MDGLKPTEYGLIPSLLGGSDSTYCCDYSYIGANATLIFSRAMLATNQIGMFCFNITGYDMMTYGNAISGTESCKPPLSVFNDS